MRPQLWFVTYVRTNYINTPGKFVKTKSIERWVKKFQASGEFVVTNLVFIQ